MRRVARRFGFAAFALSLGLVVPYLLAEGVYSIARRTSLSDALYREWFPERSSQDPSTQMIASVGEIKALLPLLKANGVGLGNSPFVELESDEAAINRTENGCLVQKPNLRKTMAYLRSNLFNPFDQVTYFHDVERQLPPELEPFFDRYGFRKVLRPALAVANAQRQAVGSQFAPLALYVDHTHLSKLGVELLLPRLADRG